MVQDDGQNASADQRLAQSALSHAEEPLAVVVCKPVGHLIVARKPLGTVAHVVFDAINQRLFGMRHTDMWHGRVWVKATVGERLKC